jgi:hypothetical protein
VPRACRIAQTLLLLLLIAAFVPAICAQESEVIQPQTGALKKSSTAAVFLSMGLPGAGQFYTHQYIKGAAAIVAEAALGLSISFNNDRMHMWQRSADNSQKELDQTPPGARHEVLLVQVNDLRSNERFYRNQRNRLIWWLAGTVMLSMGDAYVDAQLYGLDFSPNLTVSGSGVGLSIACKF